MRKAVLVSIGTLIMAALIVLPSQSLTNGDFEGGAAGWGSWNVVGPNANFGTRTGGSGYIVLNFSALIGGGSVYQTETGVDPGETWQVDAWIYSYGGTYNFGWYQTFSPYDPGPNNITSGLTPFSWTFVSVTQEFTSTSDVGYRDVQLSLGGGGQADMDDVATYHVSAVEDWCFY